MRGVRNMWPQGPDAAPSAEQIARAFVAAARETGDVGRLLEATGGGVDGLKSFVTRARWIAVAALAEIWPRCSLALLGEKLGAKPESVSACVAFARKSPQWSNAALARVWKAI